jgi:zinc finger protein
VLFPEIGFEIPSGQKGQLTTVEGLLNRAVEGLQQDQPVRRIMHPEVAGKIDEVIEKLKRLMTVDEPFTVVLDDPCGNSFIENLCAPSEDPLLKMESYQRHRLRVSSLKTLIPSQQQKQQQHKQQQQLTSRKRV